MSNDSLNPYNFNPYSFDTYGGLDGSFAPATLPLDDGSIQPYSFDPFGFSVYGGFSDNTIGVFATTLDDASGAFVATYTQNQAHLATQLEGAVAAFVATNIQNQGTFTSTLDDGVMGAIAEYDPNVQRRMILSTTSSKEEGIPNCLELSMVQERGDYLPIETLLDKQNATPLTISSGLEMEEATSLWISVSGDKGEGISLYQSTSAYNADLLWLDIDPIRVIREVGTPMEGVSTALFDILYFKSIQTFVKRENAFEYQHRDLRQYYKPTTPWVDYTPQAVFDIVAKPDVIITPNYTANVGYSFDIDLVVDGSTWDQLHITNRRSSLVWVMSNINAIDTNFTIETTDTFDATYSTTSVISANSTFNLSLATSPLNQYAKPSGADPVIHLTYQGVVVYDWFVRNDTKGILHNFISMDRQYATPNCKRWLVGYEETMKPLNGTTPWVDLPPADPDPDPPSGVTITVPVQEVYTMQNIILATLDDGVTEIQLGRVGLSDDADSSAWQFNADLLDPAEKPLVTQAGDGTPVTLYITINAEVWHVIVEKIVTGRVFGEETVKLSGRGISALISKPYEQAVSVNFGSLQTVQQIADAMLPIGWTNTWSTVTWNVDAGAYSYSNKTPLEALADLARDIGAMIVPSRNSQVLEFKPRYPVSPWDFAATAVDVAIADSAITALTEEPVSSFQGDGVYVHGHAIGGELAFCRRNGTAGTKMIPTISNALMTDGVAIRAVAKRALAAQAPQPKLKSITTFMDGTLVPYISKGSLIGVTVGGVETKGIVNAVSIEANRVSVEQTLTIGESTPNTWVAFKEILPKDPLLVATMTSTDGQTSLMNLVDGGVVRVRGTGTPTQKYYIRSGEIVSDAPALTQIADIVIPV